MSEAFCQNTCKENGAHPKQPFYSWGKCGPERSPGLPKVTWVEEEVKLESGSLSSQGAVQRCPTYLWDNSSVEAVKSHAFPALSRPIVIDSLVTL